MRPSNLRSKPFLVWASLAAFLACGALAAPQPAAAQFFFYPFAYTFHRPIEEPSPDVSPSRMASILRREGFRLDGPLGRRGDQIVASGVDAKGRRMRFIIDPYEGEVLASWRIGGAFAREGSPDGTARAEPIEPDAAVEPEARGPSVIPGVGGEGSGAEPPSPPRPKPASGPRAEAAKRSNGDPAHRAAGRPRPSHAKKVAPAPPASTATPPAPNSGAQPAVPAQATTAPPAAASDAAPPQPVEATTAPAQPATAPAPDASAAAPTNPPAAVPTPPPEPEKSPSADKSPPSVGG